MPTPAVKDLVRLVIMAMVACLLIGSTGCNLRAKIRASEQRIAVSNVKMWHDHRDWEECVASTDRAQAINILDPDIAAETTRFKARCLYKLDRREEALAHYRLIRDFLQEPASKIYPLPKQIESRLEAELSLEEETGRAYNRTVLSVEVDNARYTEAAKWSGISGQVTVQWTIGKRGLTRNIRILERAHTLLAGLAIEAVASATLDADKVDPGLLPLTKRALYRFGEE